MVPLLKSPCVESKRRGADPRVGSANPSYGLYLASRQLPEAASHATPGPSVEERLECQRPIYT